MDPICAGSDCLFQSAMNDPVNKAMVNAVEQTLQMESDLMEASVGASIGASEAGIADAGMGAVLNVQA